MNAIGFAIRRVARSFGLKNEMNRRLAITRELQLLAEAEAILGQVAWADSENIQEIAEEDWGFAGVLTDEWRRRQRTTED